MGRAQVVWLIAIVFLVAGLIIAEQDEFDPYHQDSTTGRWYDLQQVEQGALLFAQHCANCHGGNAQATPNWTKPDAQGVYPPPPLNGSAHAWHHSLPKLKAMILDGSQGRMPAWRDRLAEHEVVAIIAWFQSLWPDQGYEAWQRTHKR
ncbi:c-type cytochrome [Aestuariirhabdus sp. LZHN29]|uniref:c-type cytochrome n=1 Tax=Aestuariirhabdus sp. LZHN29 TaxID=3417462 RepID=UPI003CE9F32C